MINFGPVPAGSILPVYFSSYGKTNGESITLTGLAVTDVEIYKGTSITQRASDAGYALIDTDGIDVDGLTGIHAFSIDTGDNTDAGFYAAGSFYTVIVSAVTVDSQTVNFIAATFSIRAAESVAGVPKVDVTHLLGTGWLAPSTAGTPDVNVKLWNALTTVALPLVPTTAGRTLDVSAGGEAGVDWANVGGQSTTVNLSSTTVNLVNTTTTLTNAPSDTSGITTLLSRLSAARATKLDAISLRDFTAQAGAAGTITLDASASATDDLYNGLWVVIESGTGIGQARLITDYVGATKVATVVPNWTTTPDATSVGALVPAAKISGVTLADTVTTYTGNTPQTGDNFARLGAPTGASVSADIAAVKVDTAAILVDTGTTLDGRIPAALVGGKMDANVGAISTDTVAADNLEAMLDGTGGVTLSAILGTDAITATSMATGSIDALAFATDAVDEVAAAILVTPSQKIATDASNRIDVGKVGGDTATVTNMVRTFRALIIDTCTTGSTTTAVNAANLVGTVADQYKGRIITFRDDTTTAALRGQQTDITASSLATPTVLTVTALTTSPVSGDSFTIN